MGKLKLSAGLLVYQLMAAGRSRRHFTLNARETIEREPELEGAGLTGGAMYYDACTDDARLTLVNALSAREYGATIASYTRVTELLREDGKAIGAVVKPRLAGEAYAVRARVIVNATGVWQNDFVTDELAQRRHGS